MNDTGILERLRDEVPYDERECSHGLRFDAHCHQCEIAGYCGCPSCVDDETNLALGRIVPGAAARKTREQQLRNLSGRQVVGALTTTIRKWKERK